MHSCFRPPRWPYPTTILLVLIAAWGPALLGGCASHEFKYNRFVAANAPRVTEAHAVRGDVTESMRLYQQARLPHNTYRLRHDLTRAADRSAREELRSDDYLMIGELIADGNKDATFDSLVQAMCGKAAAEGGDAMVVYYEGFEEGPYRAPFPGLATSPSYTPGTSAADGRSPDDGSRRAKKKRKPYARALVFRYVPGLEELRRKADALPDPELERIDFEFQQAMKSQATLPDALTTWRTAVESAAAGQR